MFTSEERSAMKDRARELRAEAKRDKAKNGGDRAVRAKIAKMREDDRVIAERLHEIIVENAPGLTPKLWYGMPAYSHGDEIVCFYQPAAKFKARYATLGFNPVARLDDGDMWPTHFALPTLTEADAVKVAERVRRAVA